MLTFNNKIALRPFLESISHSCSHMEQKDLVEFVLYYAEHLPVQKRMEFLDTIASFTTAAPLPATEETLFDRISDLKDEILERRESIEDGSFYDDFDQDDWNYYDDETPEILSEEHKQDLVKLFHQADLLFLAGRLAEAHDIYAELYALFSGEESSGDQYLDISDSDIPIDQRETKARYCRCAYEISPLGKKAASLAVAMNIDTSMSSSYFNVHEGNNPLLADIEDAKREKLPDKNNFLPVWIDLLSHYNSDRAQILLMEAVYLTEGYTGIQRLARTWKGRQPRGYLFWLQLLKAGKEWKKVIDTAREALSAIALGKLRGQIASEMINAAEIIHDADSLLEGKRELFYSVPKEINLIGFLKEAKKQQAKEKEIEHTLAYMSNHTDDKGLPQHTLMEIKILLMKGDPAGAFTLIETGHSLGWTSIHKPPAVLFAGLLAALVIDQIDNAEIIKLILKRYSGPESSYDYISGRYRDPDPFFFHEILEGLRKFPITKEEHQITFVSWVESVGKERINGIVSNKHRKSYNKAAEILGGLAECFMLLGQQQKALAIIHEFRNVKYKKYSSFKRELAAVLSKSRIL